MLPFLNIYFLILYIGAYSIRLCCLSHNRQHTSQVVTNFSVEGGVPKGQYWDQYCSTALGAMGSGTEGTLKQGCR